MLSSLMLRDSVNLLSQTRSQIFTIGGFDFTFPDRFAASINPARDLGERCKLPQLRPDPGRKHICVHLEV